MKSTSDEIKNKMKINDFLSLQTLFEKLNKQLEKTLRVSEGPCFSLPSQITPLILSDRFVL